jgi:hypothetical protein
MLFEIGVKRQFFSEFPHQLLKKELQSSLLTIVEKATYGV